MKDSVAIFGLVQSYHKHLHAQLRESRRRKDYEMNCCTGSQMIALRDIGRFILGVDPQDDSNPFDGPDDY